MASEPKWVNPILNIIGVNPLTLEGLHILDIKFRNIIKSLIFFMRSKLNLNLRKKKKNCKKYIKSKIIEKGSKYEMVPNIGTLVAKFLRIELE